MTFIVFEGIDGTGKTTLIKEIQAKLNSSEVISVTEFPKSYLDGYLTRLELKDPSLHLNPNINTPLAQTLVLAGAAAYKYETQIRDLISSNYKLVLVDRYIYSVFAFQSLILQDEANVTLNDSITWLHQITSALPKPDLTIFLSVPIDIIKHRIEGRGETVSDDFLSFLNKVHESYIQVFSNSSNVIKYENIGDIDTNANNIIEIITSQCHFSDYL